VEINNDHFERTLEDRIFNDPKQFISYTNNVKSIESEDKNTSNCCESSPKSTYIPSLKMKSNKFLKLKILSCSIPFYKTQIRKCFYQKHIRGNFWSYKN